MSTSADADGFQVIRQEVRRYTSEREALKEIARVVEQHPQWLEQHPQLVELLRQVRLSA